MDLVSYPARAEGLGKYDIYSIFVAEWNLLINFFLWRFNCAHKRFIAQLAGAVEYTDCFSAEGLDPLNRCPGYDTKQSDGEAPVIIELRGMRSTPPLPLLSGPLWPGVVASERVLSMGLV